MQLKDIRAKSDIFKLLNNNHTNHEKKGKQATVWHLYLMKYINDSQNLSQLTNQLIQYSHLH